MTHVTVPNRNGWPPIAEHRTIGRWDASIYRPGGKANRVEFIAKAEEPGRGWRIRVKGSWLAEPDETDGDPPERLEEIWTTTTTEEAIEAIARAARAVNGLPPWIQPRT